MCVCVCVCVCVPILVTRLPEWLSGMEPLPHTPGAVRPSSLCLYCSACTCTDLPVLIRRTPPPTFSDTAITDRHPDTTIFLDADILVYWIGKSVRTCAKKRKLGFKGPADNNRVRRKQWRGVKKPAKYRELGVPHRTKKLVRHNYSYITSNSAFQKS